MFRLEKKFFCRGTPPSKIFWHQIWLDTCSDWEKKFFVEGPPSRGKIFWHQIWLDKCSDWKKNFLSRDTPLVKGKFFDTRFGLIHVQTGKNFFCRGTPLVKGKFFDTRVGLIHVQTGKKIFLSRDPPPRNSKKLLWPRGGRYASCVHAGGLSCLIMYCNVVTCLTLKYDSILAISFSKLRCCFSRYKYSALCVLFSAIFYVVVFLIISMSLIMCVVINNLIIKSKSIYHPPFALKKVNCTY